MLPILVRPTANAPPLWTAPAHHSPNRSLFDPLDGAGYPYLSKKPSDTVRIGRVLKADHDLYVIAVVRDPRAVITSAHWTSEPGDYYVDFPRWREELAECAEYVTQLWNERKSRESGNGSG